MHPDEQGRRRAAWIAIASTVLWGVGISPVPRVYTEHDPDKRLALLESGRRAWIVGEHLTAAATAAVPVAFVRLAGALPRGRAKTLASVAAASLAAGSPFFIWEIAIRTSDIERFARRRMGAWPFGVYEWLHVAALGSLTGALWTLPRHRKEAAGVGLMAAGSGVALAMAGDVPPFIFYIGEQIAAASLLRREAG